ncbi:MAG TPA: tetratricopeptide repeat protein, partial [Verrucomicrobiae bacterium]
NVAFFLQALGNKYTFGEAAWAAQPALSWQTTVIGDPLYRPFGKSPQLLHAGLLRENSPLLEWSYLQLANLGLVRRASIPEVAGLIDSLGVTTNSAVLTEKLADLCEAQGKPSSAIEIYGRALKLNPSPEQRIRLRLKLGMDLQAQNRYAGAIDDYRKLIEEAPDYPGKNSIEEKIVALTQKISSTKEPAKP